MRYFIILISIVFSLDALAASVFDEDVQKCIAEKVVDQFPPLGELDPTFAGVWASDDSSWDMIFLTHLDDGSFDRFFVSVKGKDYSKAQLYLIGLSPREIDILSCF
jgi:hypothetical protein